MRAVVIQRVRVTVKDTGEKLTLRTLKGQTSENGNQLYGLNSNDPTYEWESVDLSGNITVTPYVSSKNPLLDDYEGWSADKTTSQSIVTPFGSASARHSRGAPFIQTNKVDYGGSGVGDTYTAMIHALRDGEDDASNDADLAEALLTENDSDMSNLQKNAAAKLTTTVYLAEEWRKQGAGKIWRSLLRQVQDGKMDLDEAVERFAFKRSADRGRKQVGRLQDVYEGELDVSALDASEQQIYENLSDIDEDDFSSDDELRDAKKLKTKGRLYAKKHKTS